MISPTKQDLHRKVYYRDYGKGDTGFVGKWVEGRIDSIGRMLIVVASGDTTRDLNRSELEWTIP